MKIITSQWVEYARRDFDLAKDNLNEEYYSNIVLYHCQQSVEKVFKAILEENGVKFPKTHNLINLFELISNKTDITLTIDLEELNQLNDIYAESRYPGEVGLIPEGFPTKEDAVKLFNITNKIFNEALAVITK